MSQKQLPEKLTLLMDDATFMQVTTSLSRSKNDLLNLFILVAVFVTQIVLSPLLGQCRGCHCGTASRVECVPESSVIHLQWKKKNSIMARKPYAMIVLNSGSRTSNPDSSSSDLLNAAPSWLLTNLVDRVTSSKCDELNECQKTVWMKSNVWVSRYRGK